MKKTLAFDFAIPDHVLNRLDGLLDRMFHHVGILDTDAIETADNKFADKLRQVDITYLTANVAYGAWKKATGQVHGYLEYSETGVLIGIMAQMLGDWIPTPMPKFGGDE